MVLAGIIFVVVIVVATVLTAMAAKRKRLEADPTQASRLVGMPWHRSQEIPITIPEEITEEAVIESETYDSADDLLDPKNPGHAKWVAEHEPPPTDEPHPS